VPLEDGSIGHAEIRVDDTIVLAFDQRPDWPAMPSLLRVFVPDADAAIDRAVAAGAGAGAAQETLDRELSGRDRGVASRPVG
jgi:PhnB protein